MASQAAQANLPSSRTGGASPRVDSMPLNGGLGDGMQVEENRETGREDRHDSGLRGTTLHGSDRDDHRR
eukprot:4516831-Prorocentrum_lima.AAC.1